MHESLLRVPDGLGRIGSRLFGVRGRVVLLLLAVLLGWTGLRGSAGVEAQTPGNTPEYLRPGDVVRVEVWRQPELSGAFEVSEAGVLAHPLYRRVMAAGRTVREVEEDILAFLRTYESNPDFIVEGLFRVAVGGEVRQPDVHLLRPGTTLSEALALTGGISERGRLDRVMLRRGDEEFRLDLADPRARLRQVTVRSGDEIVVERRSNAFRDYVGPVASVVAALAALARLFVD